MDKPATPSREDRLAAKLRENLKRRKVQAREQNAGQTGIPIEHDPAALPKPPPAS
ncbi:MAG: hypothetical protein ABI673_07550 [Novosphingobium sp.]